MSDCEFGGHVYATSALAAQAKRQQEAAEQATEERRAKKAAAHEAALRQAFLAVPGATDDDWTKQRAAILAKDREAAALGRQDAAQAAADRMYRTF